MKEPVVIIGIGEIGSVFARGFLRTGHPVYPVTSDMALQEAARCAPEAALVMVAVGETALHPVLENLPDAWRNRLALIQNELLPDDWQRHTVDNPTVISVWFEKKKGQDVKIVVPSPIYGPQAGLLADGLDALDIPNYLVHDQPQLLFELVRKNYYILVSNISGLEVGGTVNELWTQHETLARAVALDVHAIQEHLAGEKLDHEELLQAMLAAFEGDPEHKCMGRSAPARLQRALQIADDAGLKVPTLRDIAAKQRQTDNKSF